MKLDIIDYILLTFAFSCLALALIGVAGLSLQTQYKILESKDFKDMEYQVERSMDDGWKLHGELQVQMYMGANGDVQFQIFREVRK